MLDHLRRLPPILALLFLSAFALSCTKHNLTKPGAGGELNGSLPTTGSQYAHMFTTAGTFNYHCTIHPTCLGLAGSIVVIAPGGTILNHVLGITLSGGTSGPYGASCSGLSLAVDSVFVGDTVTWTNNSPFAHTVTSR
jgi:hypothetical protein